MKIRMFALAGVAALALSGPALAGDEVGWYVDLSGGYDHMVPIRLIDVTKPATVKQSLDNAALVTGAWGYRFPDRIRIEGEVGYDNHNLSSNAAGNTGNVSITSFLINGAYDWRLSRKWDFSLGGGIGFGLVNADINTNAPQVGKINDTEAGYMYQLFAGFAYSIRENVDLTIDWRYRDVSVNK